MTIDELDEFQGMTPDMVRRWLSATGQPERECPKYQVCQHLGAHTHHGIAPMDFSVAEDWSGHWQRVNVLSVALWYIAATQGKTMQSLLREINPRMRKGVPSQEAINAHADRHWVAKSSQRGGVTRIIEIAMGSVVMVQTLSETQRIGLDSLPEGWHYWPCDDHGNKVRWPTDANGVML